MQSFIRAFAATLFASLAVGCVGDACTEAGCADGLAIDLVSPLDEPGSYTVEVSTPTEQKTCNLPSLSDLGTCDGSQDIVARVAGDRVEGVFLESQHPDELTVRILRDGDVEIEGELTPEYEVLRPNGEDCPPECTYGSTTL